MAAQFTDGQHFVKLFLGEADTRATDSSITPHVRAFLLAVARANPNGHAPFGRGTLARLLHEPSGRPRRHLCAVVGLAVRDGLLDPSSSTECLVLPKALVGVHAQQPHLRFAPCPVHGGGTLRRMATCHPHRPHKSFGRCDACYRAEKRAAQAAGIEPSWDELVPSRGGNTDF